MKRFRVGDCIKDSHGLQYVVVGVDNITHEVPLYKISDGQFTMSVLGYGYELVVHPEDALHYGEVLTDDYFTVDGKAIRIRTIKFDNDIYYYRMVAGENVQFMKLG